MSRKPDHTSIPNWVMRTPITGEAFKLYSILRSLNKHQPLQLSISDMAALMGGCSDKKIRYLVRELEQRQLLFNPNHASYVTTHWDQETGRATTVRWRDWVLHDSPSPANGGDA